MNSRTESMFKMKNIQDCFSSSRLGSTEEKASDIKSNSTKIIQSEEERQEAGEKISRASVTFVKILRSLTHV